MSKPLVKEKRRIVPTAIPASPIKIAAVGKSPLKTKWSEHYDNHLAKVSDVNYIDDVESRAVKLGYQKAAKNPEKVKIQRKKKRENLAEHGAHHEKMSNFAEFAIHYLGMKKHSKKQSFYEYLKSNFDAGKFYSSKTNRFRKNQ